MNSATDIKTILLSDTAVNGPQHEAKAAATITPGMLVEIDSNGELIPHGTSGQEGQAAVAIENDLTGRGIDDDYSSGDQVRYHVLPDGARFNGIILDGEDIAVGDALASNGDGKLKEAANTDFVVGYARAASAPSGSDGRASVEVAKGRGIA